MFNIINDNCLTAMRMLPEGSVDAVLTDPPFELSFQGNAWDATGITQQKETWQEALRVMKPGAYLLAFGATKTYHWMTCAIEMAGFEIKDSMAWCKGHGRPKGTRQLKPGFEPIVIARKPLDGRLSETANIARHGTGGLQIEAARLTERWPSNVLVTPAVADALSAQRAGAGDYFSTIKTDPAAGLIYASKASRRERNRGCQHLPAQEWGGKACVFARRNRPNRPNQNPHPCLKPIELLRHLAKLATPGGGTILDPFAGSGSTGCAAVLEGFDFIGIELDSGYCEIARCRIKDCEPAVPGEAGAVA